jgi:serine/threonine protein kinase, bacterial
MPQVCPHCGVTNRDTARFCLNCSRPFVQSVGCPACHALNPDTARFCLQCGTALIANSPQPTHVTGMLSASSLLAGRYLIVQKVGRGGMGAVYKATDTRLGHKIVAVKELSESGLTNPADKQQAHEAFEQEARILGLLNHPNLPRVSDHFSDGGRQYLVMDYIDGKTLEDLIEATSDPLDVKRVTDWAGQLCDVLDYLHNQKPPIVFRDLKPGNIMLDRDGRIKLIDFGIARLFKAGKTTDTTSFGTAGYAPPEQYGKGQTDARSDIYALGATLHHLLTGRDPGNSPFTFAPVRSLNSRVPEAIESAIMKAVEQDPTRRWQSARQMKQALTAPPPAPAKPVIATPALASAAAYVAPTTSTPVPTAPQQTSAPAVRPSTPAKPAPANVRPTGFWGTVVISVIVSGFACFLIRSVVPTVTFSSEIVARSLYFAASWVAAPLAYMLTRRSWAAPLTDIAAYLIISGYSRYSGSLAGMSATSVVLWLVFALRGSNRPSYGIMIFAPLLAYAADVAITYFLLGQMPSSDWVIPGMIGAFLGGTVAFIIGRIFGR